MTYSCIRASFLAFLVGLVFALPAFAQDVVVEGTAVAVISPAEVERAGSKLTLRQGDTVLQGDIVRTGAKGQVQLEFPDDTRIAVGPSSSLRIDSVLFKRSEGKARKFAVSALGGSFRFLSGSSSSRAYSIRTPTATMGIRGTVFDFAVQRTEFTDLVVLEGRVQFCGANRVCAVIPGGCNAVTVGRANEFSQPTTAESKASMLFQRFPFLQAQASLQPRFRHETGGCEDVTMVDLPTVRAPREKDDDRRRDRSGNPAE
jgi:hypothetical protein